MNCWDGRGNRCPNRAEYRLRDAQDNDIPGSNMCRQHAQEVLDEYARRLGWQWVAVPIDEGGRLCPGRPILRAREDTKINRLIEEAHLDLASQGPRQCLTWEPVGRDKVRLWDDEEEVVLKVQDAENILRRVAQVPAEEAWETFWELAQDYSQGGVF